MNLGRGFVVRSMSLQSGSDRPLSLVGGNDVSASQSYWANSSPLSNNTKSVSAPAWRAMRCGWYAGSL